MNIADARSLIAAYQQSQFFDRTASGWFEEDADARAGNSVGRTIGARAVGGSTVPIQSGADLVAAILVNIQEADTDAAATKDRLERARLDGLFDPDQWAGLPKDIRAEWIAACLVVRSDCTRAQAEVQHWHEYLAWARSGKAMVLKNPNGIDGLISALANSKSIAERDRRLPREPGEDDDEIGTSAQFEREEEGVQP